MNQHTNDIEELEGPFEQIAGALAAAGGSSSSNGCSVSFTVTGSLVDEYPIKSYACILQIELTGLDEAETTFELTTTPVGSNPQNEIGTQVWKWRRSADDKLKIEALPVWYGSAPDNLCYGYKAPYDLKLKATSPKGACESQNVRVEVTLPTENAGGVATADWNGAGPNGDAYGLSDAIPVQGIPGQFKCFATIYGWTPTVTAERFDLTSQYRDLVQKEEEYHTQQFKGQVSFENGGSQDLWTVDGVKWWLYYAGTQPIPFYGNSAEEARANARQAMDAAVSKEEDFCQKLSDKRVAFREYAAKKAIGIKEAYTFPCAYPKWKNMTFPPYPQKHPAHE